MSVSMRRGAASFGALEAEAMEMSRTSTLTMIVVLWVVLYM